MKDVSAVFQSLYTDWEGLKRAALYFDEIKLIDDGCGLIRPTGKVAEDGREHGVVTTYIKSVPDEVRDAISALNAEDVVTVIDGSDLYNRDDRDIDVVTFEFERNFRELFGDQLAIDDNEIFSIYNAEAPVIANEKTEYQSYQLLFSFLSRIGIQSICQLGMPFCTDSERVNQLLAFGYPNALKELSIDRVNISDIRLSEAFLAMKVIETQVPNLALESVDDVLEARYELNEELKEFRAEIGNLSSQIQAQPWETDFQMEVDRIIQNRVEPSIRSLERKLRTSNKKFLLRVLKNLRSPGAYIPLMATMFTNLPLAAAIAASCGLLATEAAVETHLEKKEIFDSTGLSFLLKVR